MMKKIVSLVVPFLYVGALQAMELQATDKWEGRHKLYKKKLENALQRSSERAELVVDFQGLAEDYYWKVDDPIAVIQPKLKNFKQYGNDAMEELKEKVLNFPKKLRSKLQYAQNTRIITAGLGVVCAVVAGTSVWLGFSQYSKGQTLLGTCLKRGCCTVIGLISSLLTLAASDHYFNDVARAQNRVNRYAKYQNQVATLFE